MNYLRSQDLEILSVFADSEGFLKYLDKIIRTADNTIDILTYSRINAIGFENLTPFQQRIIRECAFETAQFLLENNEILDKSLLTPLKNATSVEEASNIFERREQL